jgi:ADP-ribose pyrophosphatase YjhB (NUDIX family)
LVGIYDEPERDPREYVVSIAFMCKIVDGEIKAGALVDEVRSLSEAWPKKTGYRV